MVVLYFSLNDFVPLQRKIGEFTNEVFKNRQRTSTPNGILKTDAVLRFAKVRKKVYIEVDIMFPRAKMF